MATHATQNGENNKVKLPPGFTTKTIQIAISILIFITIYIGFILLFVRLLMFTLSFGLDILGNHPSFWTIILFLGANGFVVGILLLLLKIVIPSTKKDEQKETKIEITEQQYPELFKTIYEVADKVNTYRPRKVYLLPDVNASVFHEQNLLSLFRASHQNLNIGLGLVAVLSRDELKGVLAHEFGHFSQNITRVSGFIYRVNKLILELLYVDGGWDEAVAKSAELHGIITIFATLALYTAGAMRWVFQKIYGLVNISFLSLSRDLEFHADAVSVSIYGREALKNALRKFNFANVAFATTVNYLEKYFAEKIVCNNFYKVFATRIEQVALRNDIGFKNTQLVIDDVYWNNRVVPRVITKDQWASHPSDKDREDNINRNGESKPYDETPAWDVFADKREYVQEEMTKDFYRTANVDTTEYTSLGANEIIDKIIAEENETEVSGLFNHYYYQRAIDIDVDEAVKMYKAETAAELSFDDIFSKNNRNKMDKLFQNQADKAVLEAIMEKKIKVSFFEFDNIKYRRKNCEQLLEQINKEIIAGEQWIKTLDMKAFWLGIYLAQNVNEGMKADYITMFSNFINAQKFLISLNNLIATINYQINYYPVLVDNEDKLEGYLLDLRNAEVTAKNGFSMLKYKELLKEEILHEKELILFAEVYIENKQNFFFTLQSIQNFHVEKFYEFVNPLDKYMGEYYSKTLKKLTDTQLQLAGKL